MKTPLFVGYGYVLRDPVTGKIRYVGVTCDHAKRFKQHLACRGKDHKTNWIRHCLKNGQPPIMEIIRTFDSLEEMNRWEEDYIAECIAAGMRLTNALAGGKARGLLEGPVGDQLRGKLSASTKKQWEDTEFREMQSASTKKQWEDPEFREMQRALTRKRWEDPEYREMKTTQAKKQWEDPEFREMKIASTKKMWEDTEFREMKIASTKKQWEDPEYREMQTTQAKKRWEDPEYREMKTTQAKKRWEDPEYRKKMLVVLSAARQKNLELKKDK